MLQKRALAIHDISCVGRCSLTVALPILSACGVDTAVLPTAVLSTHTGGFEGYTFRDLTDDIDPIVNHWEALGLKFDAIYSGYLGSPRQLELVARAFDRLKGENTLIVVDPVMADNGQLYPGFDSDFPAGMRKLCEKADVIVPNMTEAALLLGEEYRPGPYDRPYLTDLLQRLSAIHGGHVVLTGVYFGERTLGAAAYNADTGNVTYALDSRVEGQFHGTGDVFASALTAAMVNGKTLDQATSIAVVFTRDAIEETVFNGGEIRMGPCFEPCLPELMVKLDLMDYTLYKHANIPDDYDEDD